MNVEDKDSKTKVEANTDVVYKQGNSYEEEGYDYTDNENDEVETLTNSSLVDKRKYIYIGAAILVVCIIISLIVKAIGGNETKENKLSSAEQIVQNAEVNNEGTDEGSKDDNSSVIITDGADEDTLKDASGTDLGKAVTYSLDEVQGLREAGYTASAIEDISSKGVSYEQAIKDAKDERTKYLMDLYKELDGKAQKDEQSEEFKALTSDTWLGGDLRPVVKEASKMYTTKSIRENCRYTKVSPKGGELFIKLTLKSGDKLFFNVHPSKYESLDDEGNMVIDYDQVTYGDSIYYTNLKEVPITQ